jgi:oligosaccharide repeat unit polymerase
MRENPIRFNSLSYHSIALVLIGMFAGLSSLLIGRWWFTASETLKAVVWGWLIMGIASLPLFIRIIYLSASRKSLKIDLFSPDIAFPLSYAIMYGSGFFRSAFLDLTISSHTAQYIIEGLIAFAVGLVVARVSSSSLSTRKLVRQISHWSTSRLFHAIWIVFVVCFSTFVFAVSRTGWLFAQPNWETTRTRVIDQIGGYAFYTVRSMAIVLYLAFVLLLIHKPRKQINRSIVFGVLIIGMLVLLANGYRNEIVAFIVSALAIYNYTRQRVGVKDVLVAVLVLLLGIAGYALWRAGQSTISATAVIDRAWHEIALPLLTMEVMIQNVPRTIPYMHGKGVLMTFVALLPGEQQVLGPWLKQQLGLTFPGGGFPPSVLGGFFLEFGEGGILSGMFAVGVVLQMVYTWMRRNPSDYSVVFYSFLVTYLIQGIRDGLLKDSFPVWFLLFITMLHLIIRSRRSVRLA